MFMPSWQFGIEARTRFGRCRAGRGEGVFRFPNVLLFYPKSKPFDCYHNNLMVFLLPVTFFGVCARQFGGWGGDLSPGAQYYMHTSK